MIVRQIQVYQTHCIIKIENPQQEDSAVGSLSLFCFQQSIYASVSAFLKRFTSDLRQTPFLRVSKSQKPLIYKAFRGFGIIPTRFGNFYPVSPLGVSGANSAYFPTKQSVFLAHLTGLSIFGIKLTSRFVLTFR